VYASWAARELVPDSGILSLGSVAVHAKIYQTVGRAEFLSVCEHLAGSHLRRDVGCRLRGEFTPQAPDSWFSPEAHHAELYRRESLVLIDFRNAQDVQRGGV
jgi:hypothetical protein